MVQDPLNPNIWYLGEHCIVKDGVYLEWLEDELEDIYNINYEDFPELVTRAEDLEREAAGCRNRLGIKS